MHERRFKFGLVVVSMVWGTQNNRLDLVASELSICDQCSLGLVQDVCRSSAKNHF